MDFRRRELGSGAVTHRYVVVAEDELGYRLVCDLADRVIAERGAPWLQALWGDHDLRVHQRRWTGFHSHQRWSSRGEIKRLADEHSIRAHGHGMKAELAMAHKAAQITAKLTENGTIEPAHALFLVHDTDGEEAVEANLREGAARKGGSHTFQVIVAAPHPESEAWVVAGAALRSRDEKARHHAERRRLGFDPVTSPERLSSNRSTDKRDAKRVCVEILGASGDAYESWAPCWKETPLDVLERNAALAGLRSYTRQVERMLLPLVGDGTPR